MLNNDDRQAIEGLFSRLREAERRSAPRDPEAEALIREEIARQPGAPYYMAQTVLVQERALEIAEQRIRDLEAELERRGRGDVFGGLFGGGRPAERRPEQSAERGPWDSDERHDNRSGGFLAGAAQTALGVTGGILIGHAIASMFGAGGATAAEHPADAQNEQGADAGADADAGNDDFSGGVDDGGGFDFGGDF